MKLFNLIIILFFTFNMYAGFDMHLYLNVNIVQGNDSLKFSENSTSGPNNNSLFGSVYIGENLLPKGKIYLLDNDSEGKFNKAVVHNISDGIYDYKKISDGDYTIYVIPEHTYDFNYYPIYMPTYSGNSYQWEHSQMINIENEDLEYDLNLVQFPDSYYGHNSISGEIEFYTNSKVFINVPVAIFLLNEEKEPFDFRVIQNNEISYAFNNLPEGIYYIYPESPGIYTQEVKITVAGENHNVTVDFYAEDDKILYELPVEENIVPIVKNNYISLFLNDEISGSVVCELISITGHIVYKEIHNGNNLTLNTSGLSAGIYLVRVKTYTNNHIITKKVYINNY